MFSIFIKNLHAHQIFNPILVLSFFYASFGWASPISVGSNSTIAKALGVA